MTIADEIQDLNTNLTAAKAAVTAKGGTVGDTGLAGLATEIASIPSGGGEPTIYGTIKYLDNNDTEQTVTIATADDYMRLGTLGASVVGTYVINGVTINSDRILEVEVAEGVTFTPNQFLYNSENMTKITLPSTIESIGIAFCGWCKKLDCTLNLSHVKSIGQGFMQFNEVFNHPISLPEVGYISADFLSYCSSFNSDISIGNSIMGIGMNFMRGCSSFAKPFTVPNGFYKVTSTNIPIGKGFLQNCHSFVGPLNCLASADYVTNYSENLSTTDSTAPMYTTGITLTGTYAQDWKDKITNRDSSPFRKLQV